MRNEKGQFVKGQTPWNKGLKGYDKGFQPGHKQFNSGRTHFKKGNPWNRIIPCISGEQHWNWKGGKPTCEVCGKELKYGCRLCVLHYKKENHHWWRGGITKEGILIRTSLAYKKWRKAVFERDGYTCQICRKTGGILEADHIRPFALFPELRLELSNGRVVHKECHKKTSSYLNNKIKKEDYLYV